MGLFDVFKKKAGGRKKDEPTDLEKKIQLCRGYAKVWSDFFGYFSDSLGEGAIPDEQEAGFFKIMTVLASRSFELSERLGQDFRMGDAVPEFLAKLPNLQTLQAMSEAEFSSTQIRWHEIFIELNKALGRLIQRLPVTPPAKGATPPPVKPPEA